MNIMTNTRPANTGGIDLSGIDVANVIWAAKGGLYGTPGNTTTSDGGTLSKPNDWVTNWGNGGISDQFDFSKPPADRDAEIKLLAEPEGSHPLMELFKGDDAPNFANGGPDGIGNPFAAAAALLVILWGVDHVSDGAICDALGWHHDGKPEQPASEGKPQIDLPDFDDYTDPDAMTGSLQSPSDMFSDLLAKAGVEGIDTSSVEVTDILGKLSDNMGKVAELVGALKGAAQAGDSKGFGTTLAELQKLAGIDTALLDNADHSPQEFMDNVFQAFGIAGGQDGAAFWEAAQDGYHVLSTDEPDYVITAWFSTSDDNMM